MQATNYTRELTVSATPAMVYQALSRDLGVWWGISHEGVSRIGDTMTVGFENHSYNWIFKASELVEPERIVLTCIDDTNIFDGPLGPVLQEWRDTRLVMDITQHNGSTKIHFTHEGLTPDLSCYSVCNAGWNYYMGEGLLDYLQLMEIASTDKAPTDNALC